MGIGYLVGPLQVRPMLMYTLFCNYLLQCYKTKYAMSLEGKWNNLSITAHHILVSIIIYNRPVLQLKTFPVNQIQSLIRKKSELVQYIDEQASSGIGRNVGSNRSRLTSLGLWSEKSRITSSGSNAPIVLSTILQDLFGFRARGPQYSAANNWKRSCNSR